MPRLVAILFLAGMAAAALPRPRASCPTAGFFAMLTPEQRALLRARAASRSIH